MFGLAFGREPSAVSLLIAALLQQVLYFYPPDKHVEQTWLSNRGVRGVFAHARDAIGVLLRLIGPDDDPELFAELRKLPDEVDYLERRDAKIDAYVVALDLAGGGGDVIDKRWASVICDWLGEPVLVRLRRRLGLSGRVSSRPSAGQAESPTE